MENWVSEIFMLGLNHSTKSLIHHFQAFQALCKNGAVLSNKYTTYKQKKKNILSIHFKH